MDDEGEGVIMHEVGSTVYPRQALGCVVVRVYNVLQLVLMCIGGADIFSSYKLTS